MSQRKKLIEVALPLEAISDAAASEKNIHTGLPANMHTWWSRKPLAASRAVLFASLIDDPSSNLQLNQEEVEAERQRLHSIIGRLAHPNNVNDQHILKIAREEILRATGGKLHVFFDPFAGGGSIPLEALRLGLETYAADLNPVAVILNKAMLEIAAKYSETAPVNPRKSSKLINTEDYSQAKGLAEDVIFYSEWMLKRAKKEIGYLYPKTLEGQDVVAWVWIRTVKCNNPACGSHIPLAKKFWVSTHKGNEAWAKPIVDLSQKIVRFTIVKDKTQPPVGTITNTGAKCMICNSAVPFSYIREEGRSNRMGYQLMSIVVDSGQGRRYLPPIEEHVNMANSAVPPWKPSTELPEKALGFRVQAYGITKHRDLFTNRQLSAIATFANLVNDAREEILKDSGGNSDYADAVATFLALAVDRLAQTNNTLVRWLVRKSGTSKGTPAFDRQIVSRVWEFSEGNVFGKSVGSWKAAVKNITTAFRSFPNKIGNAFSFQHDATNYPDFLPSSPIISTDPPYFDNIGYADLSDFYYIWLRKCQITG